MYKPITQWAEDDKPREKLIAKGRESLSSAELIGILLSTGTKTKSAVDLGREIMDFAKNDLGQLAKFSLNDFEKIKGIGPAKAITIIAALELGSRKKLSEAKQHKVLSSRHAYDILNPLLDDKNYEEFWIMALNQAGYVIGIKRVSEGGITGTVVDTRRIFKLGLEVNATSIIIAHNHPSGNLNPSEADKLITKKIFEAGKVMDISVKDHLIISNQGYYSFADEGLI
jgi:DNA repair protein RadC